MSPIIPLAPPCSHLNTPSDTLARKKAEREALLAAEEASLPSKPKSAPKAGSSKKKADSGILAPAAGKGVASFSTNDPLGLRGSGLDGEDAVPELSAQGIEGMLEAMEIVNQKTDKEALGAKVSCGVLAE